MSNDSQSFGGQIPAPHLYRGDRMTQKEFHLAYDEMPADYRAELLAGTVHEPSPLGLPHGIIHSRLISLFDAYAAKTPGLQTADNATVILSNDDEVQPDLILRILPQFGGQSQNIVWKSRKLRSEITYVKGAPELVAEVTHSTRAIDLHLKRDRYKLAGVREYVVVCLNPELVFWFDLVNQKDLHADAERIFRSYCFPGLWMHETALLSLDYDLAMSTLGLGLQSSAHKDFVLKLAGANQLTE
jgi:Uma2 family endonuclease